MKNDNSFYAEERPINGLVLPQRLSTNQEVPLPNMSHIISMILVGVSVILSSACSDEPNLTAVPTGIEVIPFTTGMQYLEFDDESMTIHLGKVGVYGSHSAIFEVRNTTTRSLEVESIEYVDTATSGELWGTVTWRHNVEDVVASIVLVEDLRIQKN